MMGSTPTHEFMPDGHAAAKCRVAGMALMVVGACWFFRFLPSFILFPIIQLSLPWESHYYSFTEFGIKTAAMFTGAGIVVCSYFVLKTRRYWIALFAPLICLSLFAFSCLTLYYNYGNCFNVDKYYVNLDYLNSDYWYTHPYYHLMDGMIPTEQALNIASHFADYTPHHYMDVRHHPKVEIPVQIALFFLTPTTLIGIFGLYTLLTPSVRRLFAGHLSQRVKISAIDEKTQLAWHRGLSRAYAVLMLLLLLAFLPTTILDFWKPDRYDYLTLPMNVYLNYAIVACMMIGIVSYFTKRYYAFALFTPLAWLASASYFQWQITHEYEWFTSGTYNFFEPAAWGFCSMMLIVLVSRFTLGGLGFWIWWKNWKCPSST